MMEPMNSAYVLASGIVEESGSGTVHGFVAVQAGAHARLFQVSGPVAAPRIDELPPATTVDLGRFRREIELALAPELEAVKRRGGAAAIARPSADWLCRLVLDHAGA